MVTFTDKVKHLERVRRALRRAYGEAPQRPVTHPVEHLVRTILSEEATAEAVDRAMERIARCFADWNDLRVSRPREIREMLGPEFPRAGHKARVIPRVLDQVFKWHNSMVWDFLEPMGKVETRAFFEKLEEVRPFVAATMARDCASAHAFPVDRDVARVLGRLGLVDVESESESDMQAFLERAVKSDHAYELHAHVKRLAADVCVPGEPLCSTCPLKKMCPTVAEVLARRRERKKAKKPKKAAPRKKPAAKESAGKSAGKKTKTSAPRKSAKAKPRTGAKKKKTARRASRTRRKRS
ncbi:MAG: hypothetical protein ISS74_03870 [Planctomycetes bacterium]|nr:hypothetical protein [Planctomycetota bacterium]